MHDDLCTLFKLAFNLVSQVVLNVWLTDWLYMSHFKDHDHSVQFQVLKKLLVHCSKSDDGPLLSPPEPP